MPRPHRQTLDILYSIPFVSSLMKTMAGCPTCLQSFPYELLAAFDSLNPIISYQAHRLIGMSQFMLRVLGFVSIHSDTRATAKGVLYRRAVFISGLFRQLRAPL